MQEIIALVSLPKNLTIQVPGSKFVHIYRKPDIEIKYYWSWKNWLTMVFRT